MSLPDIRALRLASQHLAGAKMGSAEGVIKHFGATQSQDFIAVKWSVGQRVINSSEEKFVADFSSGKILRTHVLRPTWHIVAQENIRWMLELTAPRIKSQSAYMLRQIGVDDHLILKSNEIITDALSSGIHLTKTELKAELQRNKIDVTNLLKVTYLIMMAEVEGLICSGRIKGKQQTYALISERAPKAKLLPKDESLAKLAGIYFESHGPASIKDFIWWSGLSAADAKFALQASKSKLSFVKVEGTDYFFSRSSELMPQQKSVNLISCYDEYTIAYSDRSAALDKSIIKKVDERNNILFNNTILVDGVITGAWKRSIKTDYLEISARLFRPLSDREKTMLKESAGGYAKFFGKKLKLSISEI